jgi:hypothetical protein
VALTVLNDVGQMNTGWCRLAGCVGIAAVLLNGSPLASQEVAPAIDERLRLLQEQNDRLQQQLREQQAVLDALQRDLSQLKQAPEKIAGPELTAPVKPTSGVAIGKLHISAQGGVGLFHGGGRSQFPNAEFRVDEAKLFFEAPIWNDFYFFSEVNLTTREDPDEFMRLGELYLDWENPLRLENGRLLNIRAGRFDIPFGEEYLTRDAIDNPLISHSLSDLWGVDEGIELYGGIGRANYVIAVQNGGHPMLNDFNADKSVAVRIGYDATKWLYLSFSAMRTGDLDVEGDEMSELWFGNGFVRALGDSATTTTFHAEVAEADAHLRWRRGHAKLAGGCISYGDNDTTANNRRDIYYYYMEGLHHLFERVYAALRWSEIHAHKGAPLVGNGDFGRYFFGPLTSRLSRLSAGIGYRPHPSWLLKSEFTWNTGNAEDGDRLHENFAGVEAAFKF